MNRLRLLLLLARSLARSTDLSLTRPFDCHAAVVFVVDFGREERRICEFVAFCFSARSTSKNRFAPAAASKL